MMSDALWTALEAIDDSLDYDDVWPGRLRDRIVACRDELRAISEELMEAKLAAG
jgi:hypothetical protein